jgi:hypothetical protein
VDGSPRAALLLSETGFDVSGGCNGVSRHFGEERAANLHLPMNLPKIERSSRTLRASRGTFTTCGGLIHQKRGRAHS